MIISNANYKDLRPLLVQETAKLNEAKSKASKFMHTKAIEHIAYMQDIMQHNDIEIELNTNYNLGIVTELIFKALYLETVTSFEGTKEMKLEDEDGSEYDIRCSISSTSLCSKINPHLPVLFYSNGLVKLITVEALETLYKLATQKDADVKKLVKIEKDLTMKLKPALVTSEYVTDNAISQQLQSLITY